MNEIGARRAIKGICVLTARGIASVVSIKDRCAYRRSDGVAILRTWRLLGETVVGAIGLHPEVSLGSCNYTKWRNHGLTGTLPPTKNAERRAVRMIQRDIAKRLR